MSYQKKIKIEDDHFKKYFPEVNASPQHCEKVKLPWQYRETLKQEEKDVVTKAYDKGSYERKYFTKPIGEGSNRTAKIKWANGFPKKPKLEQELELFPSQYVLVGCTACYTYMMVSSSNYACLLCHKRAHTIQELRNK